MSRCMFQRTSTTSHHPGRRTTTSPRASPTTQSNAQSKTQRFVNRSIQLLYVNALEAHKRLQWRGVRVPRRMDPPSGRVPAVAHVRDKGGAFSMSKDIQYPLWGALDHQVLTGVPASLPLQQDLQDAIRGSLPSLSIMIFRKICHPIIFSAGFLICLVKVATGMGEDSLILRCRTGGKHFFSGRNLTS